jgi:hypothetical protein
LAAGTLPGAPGSIFYLGLGFLSLDCGGKPPLLRATPKLALAPFNVAK